MELLLPGGVPLVELVGHYRQATFSPLHGFLSCRNILGGARRLLHGLCCLLPGPTMSLSTPCSRAHLMECSITTLLAGNTENVFRKRLGCKWPRSDMKT